MRRVTPYLKLCIFDLFSLCGVMYVFLCFSVVSTFPSREDSPSGSRNVPSVWSMNSRVMLVHFDIPSGEIHPEMK